MMITVLLLFKQKTEDEMRISDWSPDVCSSDLYPVAAFCPRRDQRFDRGNDTDADDNQIGGNHRAIRQADAGHAVLALDRLDANAQAQVDRSEEHTSELQSLMRISYAVFCLKKKNSTHTTHYTPPRLYYA